MRNENPLLPVDKEVLVQRVKNEMAVLLPGYLETPPDIDELVQIADEMGVVLTRRMANQALNFARNYSSSNTNFSTYSLTVWFSDNLS